MAGRHYIAPGLCLSGYYSGSVIYAIGFDETNVIIHVCKDLCKDFSLVEGLLDQSPSQKVFS